MKLTAIIAILAIVFDKGVHGATPVEKCASVKNIEDNKQVIQIGTCTSPPCRLKQKSEIQIEFKFTPYREIKSLTNSVSAKIGPLPIPFVGVDGTEACSLLFESDGETKANCPLKPGVEYIYRNHFDILEYYPRLKLVVHWGLVDHTGKDVMCFEVPAKITS